MKKRIEVEAKKYAEKRHGKDKLWQPDRDEVINGFIKGANFILEATRWRKVDEELPKVKDEHYFINVKKKDYEVKIETIAILAGLEDVKDYLNFYNVTH